MAFVDDPNQKSENVAGAAPLSQPTATSQPQGDSAPSQGDSSPSTIQSSGSTAPKTTNKSGKASSGMFTNIQNYVAKNQPQGQKMAENTLGEIRKANEASKEAQKNALSQFSSQTEQGGLHDTAARQAEIEAYTRSQANIVTPPPEAAPVDTPPVDAAPAPQTGIDESQFANIINAQYQGPRNLTETGNIYSQLQKQAQKSADMGKLTQTEEGRGQLLKDMNTRGGRQYGAGMSKLDTMLMGQQPNQIADIMQAGSDIGTSQDIMGRLSQQSRDIAGQRASEVQATRDASRKAFGTVASERQQEVDKRVDDVVANWDNLPAHFRESFSNPDGTVNLSKLEAVTLGINQGEGVYNLSGEDLFGSADNALVQSERNRLISKDEQANLARMQALSNLATGMPEGEKLYDIGDYFDESKAGTQTAMDALDLDHVRSQMASAERGFRTDAAKDVVGTGRGQKTYSKGFMKGSGKKHSTRTSTANVKDMLGQAGYDFNSEISDTNIGTKDILSNLASAIQNAQSSPINQIGRGPVVQGGSGAGADSLLQDVSVNPQTGIANMYQDAFESLEDKGRDIGGMGGDAIATVGDIGKDIYGTASKAVSDLGKFWGGGGSDAQSAANRIAQNAANADLQRNMEQKIKDLNYTRRSNIIEGEDADLRNQALMDILAKMDTTNN